LQLKSIYIGLSSKEIENYIEKHGKNVENQRFEISAGEYFRWANM
jgi:hypothetical protein